jgi:hypothetical protein
MAAFRGRYSTASAGVAATPVHVNFHNVSVAVVLVFSENPGRYRVFNADHAALQRFIDRNKK